MRYSLSPFLRIRFVDDGLILQNYVTHEDYLLAVPECCELLDFLSIPRETAELLSAAPAELHAEDVASFIAAGILIPDDVESPLSATRSRWEQYDWCEAFYFNWATRNYPFVDYSDPAALAIDSTMMGAYSVGGPRPANFKSYAGEPLLLPQPDLAQKVPLNAVLSLGTFNVPAARRPCLAELSQLLFCTAGKIGSKYWTGQGEFVRRTTPSGGARHPTEIYLINLKVPGLQPGVYHYNVEKHGLDLIKADESDAIGAAALAAIPDLEDRSRIDCHAILVFTSLVERSMWRYRDSRSYRVILIDVGHAVMNFRCCCEAFGLAYFSGHGFHDTALAELLSIDVDDEPPLMVGIV